MKTKPFDGVKMGKTKPREYKIGNKKLKSGLKNIKMFEEFSQEFLNEGTEFDYMMLSRLQSDCEYFLGYGKGYEKSLHQGSVEGQIAEMKKIWNALKEKPEWLTMEQIDDYETQMKNYK